jgi:hypothetical protein
METYGLAPAESDIAIALRVSGPSAHQMVRMLEAKELISRKPGIGRSIELLVDENALPKWKGKMPPYSVSVWAKSDEDAQKIVDAIVQSRLDQRQKLKSTKANVTIEILQTEDLHGNRHTRSDRAPE